MLNKLKKIFSKIGPGVITGASDDDPSGIMTYTIAGSSTKYATLWTPLFTFPLMVAMQEMCARIGLVTGKGLIGTMRGSYPRILIIALAILMVIANSINVGADLAGMASSAALIINLPVSLLVIIFTLVTLLFMIYFPYHVIVSYLKWLTFALFAYILSGFLSSPDWKEIFLRTFIPQIQFDKNFITILVAILGTTISPYLFFWQASEEVEEKLEEGEIKKKRKIQIVTKHELKEMREDVTAGMFLSNLVMFFIIGTAGSVLYSSGITNIQTTAEAAQALRPLAGEASYLLFSLGIIGTGLLAIPVLAGSAAYAVSEAFGWKEGLDKHFRQAKAFYGVIIISLLIGIIINFLGINPIKALFFAAVIYGVISPILIAVIIHIANNKRLMGEKTNGFLSNIFGGLTFILMGAAVLILFIL